MNILAVLLLLSVEDVTLDKVQSLAKVYLRDSSEVPMTVDVTIVIATPAGKIKSTKHSVAGMIFHGYNQGSGKFTVRASKSGLTPFGLGDSLGGDLAAFAAASAIFDNQATIEMHRTSVTVSNRNCPPLNLNPKFLFPKFACGKTELTLTEGEDGNLAIHHAEFDSVGSPAPTKVIHLGTALLNSFHTSVDFQLKFLPGDDKPYLWPLKTVNTAVTAKGTVTITNKYSPKR